MLSPRLLFGLRRVPISRARFLQAHPLSPSPLRRALNTGYESYIWFDVELRVVRRPQAELVRTTTDGRKKEDDDDAGSGHWLMDAG
jgi:hypothetical protein